MKWESVGSSVFYADQDPKEVSSRDLQTVLRKTTHFKQETIFLGFAPLVQPESCVGSASSHPLYSVMKVVHFTVCI